MSENLIRASARLLSTSPFMANVPAGVQLITYVSVSHTGVEPVAPRGRGEIIFTPERSACVIFSSLPSSSSQLHQNQPQKTASKLTAAAISCGFPTSSSSDTTRYPPTWPPYSRWLFSAGFYPPKGLLSLSLSCPSLLLPKRVISPSNRQRASKKLRTDGLFLELFHSRVGSAKSLRGEGGKKEGKKRKKVMIKPEPATEV